MEWKIYNIIVIIAYIGLALSAVLFLYSLISSRKKIHYQYYWKGFLLIVLGGLITKMSTLLVSSLRTYSEEIFIIAWAGRIIIVIPIMFIGFRLILKGARKEKELRIRNK